MIKRSKHEVRSGNDVFFFFFFATVKTVIFLFNLFFFISHV